MNFEHHALRLAIVAVIVRCPADATFAQTTAPAPGPAAITPDPKWVPAPHHDLSVQISEYVRCIFQDRDGELWFGTNSDGVCRYDGTSLTFLGVKDGLAGYAVREIVQTNDGAMWFTTDGGVSRYHNGVMTNYTTADGLSSNDTWSMMLDSKGTLWVGTRQGVCRFIDAGEKTVGTPKHQNAEGSDDKAFVAFPIPRAEVASPESRFDPRLVWSMYEDREGDIWFGTDGEGARKYDGQSFTTYTTKDGLCGNQIRCVRGDRHGNIWFGAEDAGASRFDGAAFQNFTQADGLGNNRVYRIFEDKSGDLWFSTLADGVTRYDGTTFTVHRQLGNLTRTHVQSMLQDRNGTLWFGCSGGLFRFDADPSASFVNVTKDGPWQ